MPTELSRKCGSLLIAGFAGHSLPPAMRQALEQGQRGGIILFTRNCSSLEQTSALNHCIQSVARTRGERAFWIGVDEEGGQVQRLPAPALHIPAMRSLAQLGDTTVFERLGDAVGLTLSTLGFNLNFAPVVDVDSNPLNPVIGARAFGSDPQAVIRSAQAYLKGLGSHAVASSLKHYPGHGDTSVDSHYALPVVLHDRERLERIELAPFRALLPESLTAMAAHVVYPALDPNNPATRSYQICTRILRGELGYDGVLFSDCLEMKALSDRDSIEDNALSCVSAGCDALLICHTFELQERALAALIREAEKSDAFRERVNQAWQRNTQALKQLGERRAPTAQSVAALIADRRLSALRNELAPR